MNTQDGFSEWLTNELAQRGWRPADLARHPGISQGQVSNVLNSRRNPGPDTCTAIANALNYPPEYIFRRAGLLPSEDTAVTEEKEAIHYLRQLPGHKRRAAIDMLRGLTQSTLVHRKIDYALNNIILDILNILVRSATPNQIETGARWFAEARTQYITNQIQEERPQEYRGENGEIEPCNKMDGKLPNMR
jgi:transcriptional regulator with XRE-family HTH domain